MRDVTLGWLMAGIVVAASWASGGVMPARVVIGGPVTGSTGPIVPTEEHENHSSTSQLVEARGNTRRREDRADSASHRPAASMFRQTCELPTSVVVPPRGKFDGHRLANGLMAPMQT